MFTFGTLVKVIAGFYIGCTGMVVNYYDWDNTYAVDLICKAENGIKYDTHQCLHFKDLEKINK